MHIAWDHIKPEKNAGPIDAAGIARLFNEYLQGIETAKQDMDLIRERLKAAQAHAKGA